MAVIKTQVFDSSRMKQQKVDSCFNARRQQERVFDARDVQAQSGAEKRNESQPGGRGSNDVRVMDALPKAGDDVREAPGDGRRAAVRGKPGFLGRGEVRRDAKDRRGDPSWQEEREVAKDKIHVNGIPPEVGEHELGEFFSAFGRVRDVVIIPVNGFGFAQQRFFPPRLRYGFVTFRAEAVVQQILKKESLVLRGYKLVASPARERRFEVFDRRQSEAKDGDWQGAAPAPGSSRDWLKEQPSWRMMDGQGRALTDQGRGHAMGRNGKGMRYQEDNTRKFDQSMDSRSSQQPSRGHPGGGHLPMEPSAAYNTYQFSEEPLHCPVNQEGFALAPGPVHEGIVPGVVNSSASTPYIFYQQPVHPAAPYLFYHHGPVPVPYYSTIPYPQSDIVPHGPAPQQQNELVPFYASQPQGETAQFLQPPAWQEISYTVPSLQATPIWQPGDLSMQQYCVYQQQQQLVTYGGTPTAHFNPALAADQIPQQQIENQGQVDTTSLSLPMRHFHPEEGEIAAGKVPAEWDNDGSSKGEWRPRFEPTSA